MSLRLTIGSDNSREDLKLRKRVEVEQVRSPQTGGESSEDGRVLPPEQLCCLGEVREKYAMWTMLKQLMTPSSLPPTCELCESSSLIQSRSVLFIEVCGQPDKDFCSPWKKRRAGAYSITTRTLSREGTFSTEPDFVDDLMNCEVSLDYKGSICSVSFVGFDREFVRTLLVPRRLRIRAGCESI
jgi:hypothetical protein